MNLLYESKNTYFCTKYHDFIYTANLFFVKIVCYGKIDFRNQRNYNNV